jgi:hypothetical protein
LTRGIFPNLIAAALSSKTLIGRFAIAIVGLSTALDNNKDLSTFYMYNKCFIHSLRPYTARISDSAVDNEKRSSKPFFQYIGPPAYIKM